MPKTAKGVPRRLYSELSSFLPITLLSYFFLVISFCFGLLLSSCTTPNKTTSIQYNNDKDFRILSAFVEDHVSGRQEGGRYKEYFFKSVVITDAPMRFDTIWVNGKALPAYVSKETNTVSAKPITFKKGDTITIRASEALNNSNNHQGAQPSPVRLEGAALLSYTVNATQKYQQIHTITKRELPNLPGGAPQQSNKK